jgi:bis(5'-nucleosyl)-tetraphosphatase (symmetrical)
MATYVVGDIQGCFDTFQRLLHCIRFDFSEDKAILLGDVVNRGPRSYETLSFIKSHEKSFPIVLGNHDIFAIALAAACVKRKKHSLDKLLKAPNANILLDFLRHQPLILASDAHVFVHAGLWPELSLREIISGARSVEKDLQSAYYQDFLTAYFDKNAAVDSLPPTGTENYSRFILSSLTLLRSCRQKNMLDRSFTGLLKDLPKNNEPWFYLRKGDKFDCYFGHWAALGIFNYKNYHGLDSGCVWGAELSAFRLDDQKLIQVAYCD